MSRGNFQLLAGWGQQTSETNPPGATELLQQLLGTARERHLLRAVQRNNQQMQTLPARKLLSGDMFKNKNPHKQNKTHRPHPPKATKVLMIRRGVAAAPAAPGRCRTEFPATGSAQTEAEELQPQSPPFRPFLPTAPPLCPFQTVHSRLKAPLSALRHR